MQGNSEIIRRSTVTKTALGADNLLSEDKGVAFVNGIMTRGETLGKIRLVTLTTPSKSINKMLVTERMARKGSENTAPRTQNPFSFDKVTLTPVKVDVAYELTDEALEDNIERAAFESRAAGLTEQAFSRDLNDLLWNGDDTDYSGAATTLGAQLNAGAATATVVSTSGFPAATSGYGFLVIGDERITYTAKTSTTFTGLGRGADDTDDVVHTNGTAVTFVPDALLPAHDGVIKLVNADGNVVDPTAIGDGTFSFDLMESMVSAVPEKYLQFMDWSSQWRWFANRKTQRAWQRYVAARMTALGDNALQGEKGTPLGYAWHVDAHIPDGTVMFGPLPNIIQAVRTNDIRYRTTAEGKDLVSRDARYYKWSIKSTVALDEPTAMSIAEGVSISVA